MELTIRRITINDAKVLSEMAMQTFYDTFTGTCTEEDMQQFLHHYYREEQTIKELSNEDDFFFLSVRFVVTWSIGEFVNFKFGYGRCFK